MNDWLAQAPRTTRGVGSEGSGALPARLTGLWQCPSAKYVTPQREDSAGAIEATLKRIAEDRAIASSRLSRD